MGRGWTFRPSKWWVRNLPAASTRQQRCAGEYIAVTNQVIAPFALKRVRLISRHETRMAKPPRDPPVADREPSTDVLPFYDDDHCVVYLRLLDAGCRVSRPHRQGGPRPRNGPSDRPKPRLRQGAIIQPDIFTISRANRSWYPSPPGIALAQQAQKPPESRIVVGSPPIGDIVDQGWFVVAIDLTVDDPRVRGSGPAFVQQADALSGAHHAQDVFAADVVAQDGWLVASGDVGGEDVVDFRSRILAGQQEAFPLKVLPVDPRMRSERVVLRHRDHDALTPERHGIADHPVDLPGDDYDIDFLAFEAGDQPRS